MLNQRVQVALVGVALLVGCSQQSDHAKSSSLTAPDDPAVLVVTSDEPAGVNCESGGQRVDTGHDLNGNGVLDSGEIESTQYVCDSGPGVDAGPVGAPDGGGVGAPDGGGAPAPDAGGPPDAGGHGGCSVSDAHGVIRVTCGDGSTEVLNGAALTPVAVKASSETAPYAAANVLSDDEAPWMSAYHSGNPEWLEYDLGKPAVITAISAYILDSRDGSPVIQGSNDESSWTTLSSYDFTQFQYDAAPYVGCGTYFASIPAPTNTGYRYVRVYSEGAPFLAYAWLQFDGVVLR